MYLIVTVVSDTPVSKHLKHDKVNYSYALSPSQASIEKQDVFTGNKRVGENKFVRTCFSSKNTMVFKALRCALFMLKSFVFLVVCLPGQRALCKLGYDLYKIVKMVN